MSVAKATVDQFFGAQLANDLGYDVDALSADPKLVLDDVKALVSSVHDSTGEYGTHKWGSLHSGQKRLTKTWTLSTLAAFAELLLVGVNPFLYCADLQARAEAAAAKARRKKASSAGKGPLLLGFHLAACVY